MNLEKAVGFLIGVHFGIVPRVSIPDIDPIRYRYRYRKVRFSPSGYEARYAVRQSSRTFSVGPASSIAESRMNRGDHLVVGLFLDLCLPMLDVRCADGNVGFNGVFSELFINSNSQRVVVEILEGEGASSLLRG